RRAVGRRHADRLRLRPRRGAVRSRRGGARDRRRARARVRACGRGERPSRVHPYARERRARRGRARMTGDGVVVIGGGIAGLAAAHRLTELAAERGTPVRVTLVEGAARLGGTIASEKADGFLVESGADSFLTEKPWALALCRRIGLENRVIGTR